MLANKKCSLKLLRWGWWNLGAPLTGWRVSDDDDDDDAAWGVDGVINESKNTVTWASSLGWASLFLVNPTAGFLCGPWASFNTLGPRWLKHTHMLNQCSALLSSSAETREFCVFTLAAAVAALAGILHPRARPVSCSSDVKQQHLQKSSSIFVHFISFPVPVGEKTIILMVQQVLAMIFFFSI